jgi:hypothetical protein
MLVFRKNILILSRKKCSFFLKNRILGRKKKRDGQAAGRKAAWVLIICILRWVRFHE